MMRSTQLAGVLLMSVLLMVLAGRISAQSSVVFVPSTDIQPGRSTFVSAEFYSHFDSYKNGGFQSFGPSAVYGVRKDLEIGANFYLTRDGSSTSSELQPNVKWSAFRSKDGKIAVAVGAVGFIPLNSSAGSRSSVMLYTNASRRFESVNGMRLTGGIYRMVGANEDHDTKTGALLAVEQPITERLTFLTDWTSGNNRLGYANVGLGYEMPGSQYLTIAYSFGNSGRGNNFLSAFYGFSF